MMQIQSPFVWGSKGEKLTPEQVARRQAQAAMQLQGIGDTSPVDHWLQGAGRVVNAITGKVQERRADASEKMGMDSADAYVQNDPVLAGLLGGQGGYSAPAAAAVAGGPQQGLADEAMTAIGRPSRGGNRETFIQEMMPHAIRVAQQTGLDPRLVIAQAAQETGWGKSAPGNNYFGIKSHGKGGGNTFATNEVVNGQTVRINDSFRGYGDMGDSADGYASFLQENPRYKGMLSAEGLEGQLSELGRSGYATDPNYAKSVGSIAQSISLPDGYTAPQGGGGMSPQGQPMPVTGGGEGVVSALAGAMSNPWVAKKYGPVIDALMGQQMKRGDMQYQQQLAQSDPGYQLGLEKSRLELDALRNPAVDPWAGTQVINGQVVTMDGGKPKSIGDFNTPEPGFTMVSPDEAASLGLPAGAYQRGADGKISEVGGGGTTINNNMGEDKFGEAFAKGDATTLGAVSDSGLAAQRNLGRIDQLEKLLASSPTGAAGAIAQAAGEWGINTEGLAPLQAAHALINSLVPEQRQPGSGPMSDADLALFKQSLPRIINQPGGNEVILNTMRAIAQYDADGAKIVQELRAGKIDRATAFQALQNRPNPLQGFKQPAAPAQSEPQADGDAEYLKSLGLE